MFDDERFTKSKELKWGRGGLSVI